MNRDEIMALSAEELRVEIARVKGWEWKTWFDDHTQKNLTAFCKGHSTGAWYFCENLHFDKQAVPNWPGDIAAAFELVLEAEAEDIRFELSDMVNVSAPPHYDITFSRNFDRWYACAETMPLAICRAWLLWKHDAPTP